MSVQAPTAVVMIRPHHFRSNPDTMADNAFQAERDVNPADAMAEFDEVVAKLNAAGVTTHVFDDESKDTPDSVFPNNWFSTHAGGHVAVYPMFAANRRRERRWDVIDLLKAQYRVQEVIDYSGLEHDGLALEGTGAMVLDHLAKVAYVAKSHRADPVLLERFCAHFGYEPLAFDAADAAGSPVYHTNVLMAVATDYALICLDMITDTDRRAEICERLEEGGRHVINLTAAQIGAFAGNAIELAGASGRLLALSRCAYDSLTPDQRAIIERSTQILPLSIPTIETAGGSVRCMLAGVHLARRPVRKAG